MSLNLFFITSFFANNPHSVKEGTSYRIFGFYSYMVKLLLQKSPLSKIFWYSNMDGTFRNLTSNKTVKFKSSLLRASYNAIHSSTHSGSPMFVVIGYPSVFKAPKIVLRLLGLIELFLSLLLFRFFALKNVKIILDICDPPVESKLAFSENESSCLVTAFRRAMDIIFLNIVSEIVVLTNSYKQYLSRLYKIDSNKITIVPCGSVVDYVPFTPPKMIHPIKILYAGHATKTKDFDKLVTCISNLREKGLDIDLQVAGGITNLPKWIKSAQFNWLDFVENVMSETDIGVIPYPTNKLHFNYTSIAKLADYMASGKPIVSTNLKETAKIIKRFNCGLIAENWNEFETYIEQLYFNHDLAMRLGKNGRIAIEQHLNYPLLAESFLKNLISNYK